MNYSAIAFDTPLDRMVTVVHEDGAVALLAFLNGRSAEELVAPFAPLESSTDACSEVVRAVDRFFEGKPEALETLHLRPAGNAFQHEVWSEVRKVPWGETASYGEIAERIRSPGASRAVGQANATNPICLAIPCHRIVGADGSLTGYGGGIETKRALLGLESGQQSLRLV